MNHSTGDHPRLPKRCVPSTTYLETHLAQALDERASHIHFTSQMRQRVLDRIAQHHQHATSPWLIIALACLLLLVVGSSTLFYTHYHGSHAPASSIPTIIYAVQTLIATPPELAQGGQIISLDPTGQHLIYQPANQPGVMYMADIADPIESNLLVMRYAHDVTWAPDGSALATTVSPAGAQVPLLALVPLGKYMSPLGEKAEAACWLPTSPQEITYTTHSSQQTHLWSTTPQGHSATIVATMDTPLTVLHLAWSLDGQQLALVVALPTTSTAPSSQAIYLMNARTHALQTLIAPDNVSLSTLFWSPDQRYLAYAQTNAQGITSLQALSLSAPQSHISIPLRHPLLGWSWSPDSHSLVYSDGGVLKAFTLRDPGIVFPGTSAQRIDPFWLPNGNLLYLNITQGSGKLAIMQAVKEH